MIKEIDLRILTFIECETKMEKISEILKFLNLQNIRANLSMLYDSDTYNIQAENLLEYQEIPSLTIDEQGGHLRFKYWNGLKTYWTHHSNDLFQSITEANMEYNKLSDKYAPVTSFLLDWKRRYDDEIFSLRFQYYPEEDVDILYTITFQSDMKNDKKTDELMNEIFELINDNFDDLNMILDHNFKLGCSACEKRRKQNEKSNRSDNEH